VTEGTPDPKPQMLGFVPFALRYTPAYLFRKTPSNQAASSRFINCFQGGIAVLLRPSSIVVTNNASGLPARLDGNNAGPMPPCKVKPWQAPQSFLSRLRSSVCRSGDGSAQVDGSARLSSKNPKTGVLWRCRIKASTWRNRPRHWRYRHRSMNRQSRS